MQRFSLLLLAMALAVLAYGQSSLPPRRHIGPLGDSQTQASNRNVALHFECAKQNTTSTLDSFFTAIMSTYHVPGLAACIVKEDSILWLRYYGHADLPNNKPVTDSTIFLLASTSKTITVTALMQLYEKGKFKLDDSVNAYLPFQVRNPMFPGTPITFRMLLTHTSSIQDNMNAWPQPLGDYPGPLGTYLQQYFTPGGQWYSPELNFCKFAPGTAWNYSNVGTGLIGYLVEVITGVPFDRYCRDSIFAPLQMTNTAWFLRDLKTSLIARPYTYISWNGNYWDRGLYGYPFYPAGLLRTTAPSLARFLMANINGGELKRVRILDSGTVRMIRTVYVPSTHEGLAQDGFIWIKTDLFGHDLWGHDGALEGTGSGMWLSEEDRTGVLWLANTDHDLSMETAVISRLIDEARALTVGVREGIADIPKQFELLQNYPNPFNPSTTIKFELPKTSHVSLTVYDILGREVSMLVSERRDAGVYEVKFDGSNLASGVYFYRIQAGDFTQTKRLILLK